MWFSKAYKIHQKAYKIHQFEEYRNCAEVFIEDAIIELIKEIYGKRMNYIERFTFKYSSMWLKYVAEKIIASSTL